MKAISLLQPCASLVIIGAKKYETRSWNTFHRGRILIHASAKKDPIGMNLALVPPFDKYIKGIQGFYRLPFGAIIGECMIESTVRKEDIRGKLSVEEISFGDYSTGRMAWRLTNPISYRSTILYKGSLSIWDFPDELLNIK